MPRTEHGDESAPVLIVEDDAACAELMVKAVRRMGFTPLPAANLRDARRLLADHDPGLVLLDRNLEGGGDGLSLCLELKKDPRTRLIPVIVLTAMDKFSDELKGVRFGADLYLRKPVDIVELEKYIKALVGRIPYKEETAGVLRCGDVILSRADRTFSVGRRISRNLPDKQFDFLALLVSRRGVPREFLIQKLWNNEVRDKEVDVLVSRLRRRLGPASAVIVPVRSHGYRLACGSSETKAG